MNVLLHPFYLVFRKVRRKASLFLLATFEKFMKKHVKDQRYLRKFLFLILYVKKIIYFKPIFENKLKKEEPFVVFQTRFM